MTATSELWTLFGSSGLALGGTAASYALDAIRERRRASTSGPPKPTFSIRVQRNFELIDGGLTLRARLIITESSGTAESLDALQLAVAATNMDLSLESNAGLNEDEIGTLFVERLNEQFGQVFHDAQYDKQSGWRELAASGGLSNFAVRKRRQPNSPWREAFASGGLSLISERRRG